MCSVIGKEGNEGSFGFTTDKQGEYKFCFQSTNQHPDHQLEVEFDLKVGFEAKDYSEVAKKEHLKPIELELLKLNDMSNDVLAEMQQIRHREVFHRETTESTNFAVVGWSALSLVIIVVLGVYQTFYLKRYFKTKKLI